MLGTSQAALSQIERGQRGLTVQQVVKLARSLGATPNDILGNGRRERSSERPKDSRILRRFYRIEKMSEDQQHAALKMLDSFIDAHSPASSR
jgi:transcriptional regulator with XRE-family HTH domain